VRLRNLERIHRPKLLCAPSGDRTRSKFNRIEINLIRVTVNYHPVYSQERELLHPSSRESLNAASIVRDMRCSRALLWNYLVDPDLREQWWPNTSIELWPGGSVRSLTSAHDRNSDEESDELCGEVDVFINGHALGFVWSMHEKSPPTSVLITLASTPHGTIINLAEVVFRSVEFASSEYQAERLNRAERLWHDRLRRLQSLLADREQSVVHNLQEVVR